MSATLPNPHPRRPLARLLLSAAFTAVLVASALSFAPAAVAQEALLDADDPSSTLLPELNVVEVSGAGVASATDEVYAVLDEIAVAVGAEDDARFQQQVLAGELADLQAETRRLNEARDAAILARNTALGEAQQANERVRAHEDEADHAQAILDEIALQAFMGASNSADLLETPGFSPAGQKTRYLEDVFTEQYDRRRGELEARATAQAEEKAAHLRAAEHEAARLSLENELAANEAAITRNGLDTWTAAQAQTAAQDEQARLDGVLVEAKEDLAAARRTGIVAGADFPLVVLDAFVRAERYEAEARPGCNLDWALLAAISRVESSHGTYGGSSVDALGQTPTIFGPQLAPGSGFATITDTDGGALDGDPNYDRAVGPMQFIPSSWRIFALDGNGDGEIDPRNYYDASLAAAEHLCRAGWDTSSDAGLRGAVFSYNQSESYVNTVLSVRNRYLALTW